MTPSPTGPPTPAGPNATTPTAQSRATAQISGKNDPLPGLPSLTAGATITARVIAPTGNRLFLLELTDGSRLTAQSDIELTPGATVRFTVLHAGPPPVLAPSAEPNTALARAGEFLRLLDFGPGPSLLQRLAALQDFFSGERAMPPLDRLAALLTPLALGADPAPAKLMATALLLLPPGGGLRHFVSRLEAGDRLFSRLRAAAPASLHEDIDYLERFLRLNDLLAGQRPSWLALPLLFADQGRGWLMAETHADAATAASLTLLLELTRLGPLRAALLFQAERLAVTITTPTEAVREHLASWSHELARRLAALHSGRLSLASAAGPVNLPADAKRLVERKLAEPAISLVDIRI